jgi:hypothetical protein
MHPFLNTQGRAQNTCTFLTSICAALIVQHTQISVRSLGKREKVKSRRVKYRHHYQIVDEMHGVTVSARKPVVNARRLVRSKTINSHFLASGEKKNVI